MIKALSYEPQWLTIHAWFQSDSFGDIDDKIIWIFGAIKLGISIFLYCISHAFSNLILSWLVRILV